MEIPDSPQEFTAYANRLFARAMALSRRISDDSSELSKWLVKAKAQRMSWVEGLCFAIENMEGNA